MRRFLIYTGLYLLSVLCTMTSDFNSLTAGEDAYRKALVLKVQSITMADWFSKKCNGILRAETSPGETFHTPEEQELVAKANQEIVKSLTQRWQQGSQAELEQVCLKSLILFGPKGTRMSGLLSATPELQEKLPLDTRKLIGF